MSVATLPSPELRGNAGVIRNRQTETKQTYWTTDQQLQLYKMSVAPIINVQPVEDQTVEQLKSIFHQHYKGCQIDIDNIRDFEHTGFNSELRLVDVIIKENGRKTKVMALIKTTEKKRMKKCICRLTRYMMREVLFYT